jgi:hypothetical protein
VVEVVVGRTCADEDVSDFGDEFSAVVAAADAVDVAAAAVVVAAVVAAAVVVAAAADVAVVGAVVTVGAAVGEVDHANVDGIDGTAAAWFAADEVIGGKPLAAEGAAAVVVGDATVVDCNHCCTESRVGSEWVEVRGLAKNVATRHNRPKLLLRFPSYRESTEQIRCLTQVCRRQDLAN